MTMRTVRAVALTALLVLSVPFSGNAASEENAAGREAAGASSGSAEEENILTGLRPVPGPTKATLGSEGAVDVPAGILFFNAKDTRTLLERMENITSGEELGLVAPEDLRWIAVFSFDDTGYVEDTGDAADIDADALLDAFHKGAVAANKEKAARGWATSEVVDWSIPPHYNKETKNLEWALRFKSQGREYDNYSVRILGRGGVMKVIFAGDNEGYAQSLNEARTVITGYSFVPGKTHAEWRQGDKIAGYGLAALIAGGTVAAVAKSGLLGKLIKPIGVAVVAALAAIANIFRRKKKGGGDTSDGPELPVSKE